MKNKFKEFFKKYITDLKFNNICTFIIEIPLFVIGLVTKNYALSIFGPLVVAIINKIILKVGQKKFVNKILNESETKVLFIDNFIDNGNNEGGEV